MLPEVLPAVLAAEGMLVRHRQMMTPPRTDSPRDRQLLEGDSVTMMQVSLRQGGVAQRGRQRPHQLPLPLVGPATHSAGCPVTAAVSRLLVKIRAG